MNLVELFLKESKSVAVVDGKDKYTYEKLSKQSRNLAGALTSENLVKANDRVVLIANNSAEFIISYLAILCCGAICVPLDPHTTEAERARDIGLVKPNLLLCASDNLVSTRISEKIPLIEFNSSRWREFLKHKPSNIVERSDDDVAVMLMSSPPNSPPRPAMLTHGSLINNLKQVQRNPLLSISKDDKILTALPMYHIFGLHVVAGYGLNSEAALIIARSFDAIELSSIISHNKITIVPGVPALFEAFVNTKEITIDLLNKVRLFISGGAMLSTKTRDEFKDRFGAFIGEGYGLTEASPMISFQIDPKCEGDIGNVLPGIEIDIRDSTGASSLTNDAGQIVVRGLNIFKGYFMDSNATQKVLDSNGWLYTGDIGLRDDEDSIILLERTSDVIVVDGFSVFPSEVEEVINRCELVEASAVVGELDERSGEMVLAYVQLISRNMDTPNNSNNSDTLDPLGIKEERIFEQQIRDFCLKNLARYKIPKKIIFIDEMSYSSRAKPLRKSLKRALINLD